MATPSKKASHRSPLCGDTTNSGLRLSMYRTALDDNHPPVGAVWTVMIDQGNGRGWVLMAAACASLALGVSLARPVTAFAHIDSKTAGAELFATRGCAHCHGDDGQGTDRAPALRELRKKLSADKIRDQIVHGGQGMPAFGDSLKDDEVEALVSFLRAKKWVSPPAVVHPTESPAPATKPE